MGAQLKEGLSQVQVAMAAGLFEGLKEVCFLALFFTDSQVFHQKIMNIKFCSQVTADVKRINQLVRQVKLYS